MIQPNCGNPPPRGKVRYKIPNYSPYIPHISPGCGGGGGVRLISASVFAILKLNIFSANEKFTFMSGQPINSFLLLKLKIFSGNLKNFLGPMVSWSDTFSTPVRLRHPCLPIVRLTKSIFSRSTIFLRM